MTSPEPVVVSWSGGKDSLMALREIQASGRYRVETLLTTVAEAYDRVCIHGVRCELLRRQAEALQLPLHEIRLAECPTNAEYEAKFKETLAFYRRRGIRKVAFGDLFLEDLKAYRDRTLGDWDMEGVYPIWKRDTRELVAAFIALHYKAIITCVDTRVLPGSFSGRRIEEAMVKDLPAGVDPCGENGEFHSFVYDGPSFAHSVRFTPGEKRNQNGFCFTDLVPVGEEEARR